MNRDWIAIDSRAPFDEDLVSRHCPCLPQCMRRSNRNDVCQSGYVVLHEFTVSLPAVVSRILLRGIKARTP